MVESLEPEQLNEKTLNDMRSGSEVLVEALLKENDYLFGYPGGAVLPLYDTFYDGKIKHIFSKTRTRCCSCCRRLCTCIW